MKNNLEFYLTLYFIIMLLFYDTRLVLRLRNCLVWVVVVDIISQIVGAKRMSNVVWDGFGILLWCAALIMGFVNYAIIYFDGRVVWLM